MHTFHVGCLCRILGIKVFIEYDIFSWCLITCLGITIYNIIPESCKALIILEIHLILLGIHILLQHFPRVVCTFNPLRYYKIRSCRIALVVLLRFWKKQTGVTRILKPHFRPFQSYLMLSANIRLYDNCITPITASLTRFIFALCDINVKALISS